MIPLRLRLVRLRRQPELVPGTTTPVPISLPPCLFIMSGSIYANVFNTTTTDVVIYSPLFTGLVNRTWCCYVQSDDLMLAFCEFVTKIQARRNEWDATCKGTGDTINYRTMERDLVGLHRQTQGALGDTKNYGHGRGSAHMEVE